MNFPQNIFNNNLLAEEIGWHLGDGTMGFYKNKEKTRGSYALRGHIIDDFLHYQNRICPVYFKLFSFKPSLRKMSSTGVCGFPVWSDNLVNFKKKLGLPLGPKLYATIPPFLLRNKKLYSSFLRGLFDTDGNLYLENKRNKIYPRIHISSVSQDMLRQAHFMALRLGLRSTVYLQRVTNPSWNDKLILSVRGHEQIRKWFDIVSSNNPKHLLKYVHYQKTL